MAMQPEWLTSTVTALARCFCLSSSHSTRNFTREMMRLCERIRAQRSSRLFFCVCGVIATTTSLRIAFSGAGTSESSPMDGPGQWYFFEKVTGDGGGPTHPRPPCQRPGGPARDPNAGGLQHLITICG